MTSSPGLRPGIGFCVQSESACGSGKPGRWYVNICKHRMVEMPLSHSGKPASREHILAHGLGSLHVPFDMGTFRKLKERSEGAKQATYCIDVIFNPFIVQLFMEDEFCNAMEDYRPFVINLTLNRIETSIGVKLVMQKVKLVKSLRYKDGEGDDGDIPREFMELPGEGDDPETEPPSRRPPSPPLEEPLIEDVTPGVAKQKRLVKKGFLNQNSKPLYGPDGSKEGVLPENAGDPMGWMPKKLRQKSKIVDCNSPEFQENERKRRAAEESNKRSKEFSDTLKNDLGGWAKRAEQDKWSQDVPEGTDKPSTASTKYDVDYSRFDAVDDIQEKTRIEERDWYYDNTGKRCQIESPEAPSDGGSATKAEAETPLKKGFLDGAKTPLYPKEGSQQAKTPVSDEQLLKDFSNILRQEHGDDPLGHKLQPPRDEPRTQKLVETTPERKPPEFKLSETLDGLQLVVDVPGLDSMQGVDLDVTDRRASMKFPSAAAIRPLQVELPFAVIPTEVRAKFSKKARQITVRLPVAASAA